MEYGYGWTILRFWNDDILRDIDNVCQHIVIPPALAASLRSAEPTARNRPAATGSTSMIDHLGITVSDFDASKAFYDKAMAPLGASLLMVVPPEYTGGVKIGGYGRDRPTFWMQEGERQKDHQHVAFTARSRAEVDAFHAAAIAAGGRTMAGRGCGRCIIRTTTAPSSSTPTATMSKPSATIRHSEGERR